MPEQWRAVVGYEGIYSVSDQGRVRSERRVIARSNGRPLTRRGQILKTFANVQSGHMQVRLSRNGIGKTVMVHALVLAAFIGPRPAGLESLHFDDNPANNHLSNLRYGTRSENFHDRVRNGKHHCANKTHCVNGHEFTRENTYLRNRPGGGRTCRQCNLDRAAEKWQARKASA